MPLDDFRVIRTRDPEEMRRGAASFDLVRGVASFEAGELLRIRRCSILRLSRRRGWAATGTAIMSATVSAGAPSRLRLFGCRCARASRTAAEKRPVSPA